MIKLMKSSFFKEDDTKELLIEFIKKAETFSMGDQCRLFEEKFAEKQGRKHALFVSSGSMANLVLIQALLNLGHLKKGDRVGVSALTWATNIMPIIQLGLEPVILDCEIKTLNVSISILEKAENLRAVFLTNVLGFCDDITKITDYCSENNILLLEDNCESLGSRFAGKMLGNFGFASTFSSFVGHHFSTIEGGVVATDDTELHKMLMMVRAHGWDRNLEPADQQSLRKKNNISDFHARYTFYDLAYNARPTEINGFIGNTQLQYWDEIVERRQKNFYRFQAATNFNNDFYRLKVDHLDTISNFAMPIVCKTAELFHKYRAKFEEQGVEIRPVIAGDMSRQPFYRKYVKSQMSCPNARIVNDQGFYFPNNPELTDSEIQTLLDCLKR